MINMFSSLFFNILLLKLLGGSKVFVNERYKHRYVSNNSFLHDKENKKKESQ